MEERKLPLNLRPYSFSNPEGIYFITFATVQWVDVLTRRRYKDVLVESLRYCIQNKGLILYAWVLMSNHVHLIVSAQHGFILADILRDLKKFASSQLHKELLLPGESRRNWLIWLLESAGVRNKRNQQFQLWQQENHAMELLSAKFQQQKLDYIHRNPAEEDWVDESEHYVYSSALDYAGGTGLLPLVFLE